MNKTCLAARLLTVIALCSAQVQLGEPPSARLNRFFGALKGGDALSRKVSSAGVRDDDDGVSVMDFFQIWNAKTVVVDDFSPIAASKTHKVSRLFNIVVSCEYGDYLYRTATAIVDTAEDCRQAKFEGKTKCFGPKEDGGTAESCYKDLRDTLFRPLADRLSEMIFTLLGLQRYIRNFVSKNQDVLKTMLTVHLLLKRQLGADGGGGGAVLEKLKCVIFAFRQIKLYLERFDVARCETSKNNRNGGGGKKPVTFDFENVPHRFVTSPNGDYFDHVYDLVRRTTDSSANSAGKTFLDKLKADHDDLNASTDLGALLAHETRLLDTIAKIIVCIAADQLEDIDSDATGAADKNATCNARLLSVLDEYAATFRAAGQPAYLTYKMALIGQRLWLVCNKMKSAAATRSDIGRFRALASSYPYEREYDSLGEFLSKLSAATAICGRLSPAVSNTFWAEMYYHDTEALDYMVDLKPARTGGGVVVVKDGNRYCETTLKMLDCVKTMDYALDKCDGFVRTGDLTYMESSLAVFRAQCDKLRSYASHVLATHLPRGAAWRKLLILLRYNLDHTELFDVQVLKTIGARRLRDLRVFDCDVRNSLIALHYAHCGCNYDLQSAKAPGRPSTPRKDDKPPPATQVKPTAIEQFHEHFSGFAAKIAAGDRLDQDLRLYWDGEEKTLREVVYGYRARAFDLQDVFALQSFVTKWLLAAVYTGIRDVVDATVFFERPLAQIEIHRLRVCLGSAYAGAGSPLFLYGVSELAFARFLEILGLSDGSGATELAAYRRALDDELESIGVVSDSIPNHRDGGVSERIASLETIVDELKKSNVAHGSSLTEFAKSFGITDGQIFREIK